MGGGSGSVSSTEPVVHHIKVNSSVYGTAIPIVYGRGRMPSVILWTGDFAAHQSSAGGAGKGTGGSSGGGTTTYSVSVLEALCAGPIPALGRTWTQTAKGTRRIPLASAKWTINLGAIGQAAWSYLTTRHPGQDIGYSGLVTVALANWDIGTASVPPPRTFEVFGFLSSATGSDVNPGDAFADYFTDTNYGLGLSAGILGNLLTTFKQYCLAAGINLSIILDSQKKAVEWIQDLTQICNVQAVWSQGVLNLIPLIDNSSLALNGRNGSTFDASVFLTPIYSLTEDDFITSAMLGTPTSAATSSDDEDPITVTTQTPADRSNSITVEYTNIVNDYALDIVEAKDEGDIAQNGLRPGSPLQMHAIPNAQLARTIAQIQLQRILNVPNQYRFRLRQQYVLLDPMDVVNVTDLGCGLNNLPVRILEIEEESDDEGALTGTRVYTAEDLGPNYSPGFGHQPPAPWGSEDPNRTPLPVNPPIIFEPSAKMLGNTYNNQQLHGALEVWILASGNEGQDANTWQGANVYMSLDGSTYNLIGAIRSPATMGVLLSTLPTHVDPDGTSTLAVDLSESNGVVSSVSHALADQKQNLAFVDTELISFADVTAGASANQYNLKYLRRGLYTSSPAAHAAGTYFGFLGAIHAIDPAILRVPITADMIGQTLYFKLTSVNPSQDGESDLSDAVAYTITPAGSGALPVPGASDPLGFINPVTNNGGWFDVQNQIVAPVTLAELILSDTNFVGGFGIQYDWYSNGQLSFFVDHGTAGGSGENGYLFRLSPVSGVQPARVFRVDNGALTEIATYPGVVNPSTLSAIWRHAAFTFRRDGTMEFALDGVVRALASDTTYTANGPVGYGYEGAAVTRVRHPTFTTDSGDVSSILPDVTSLTGTITKKADVQLKWAYTQPRPHDFLHFEVRSGSSFAAGTFIGTTKQNQYLVTDPAQGSVTYWVAAIDINLGVSPSPASVSANLSAPGDVTSLTGIVTHKNDVKLDWNKPASLPTGFANYEIRVGASWAAGTFVDTTKKTELVITDPVSGSNTYWVGVQDLAGNYDATQPSVTVVVPTPGDVTSLTATLSKKGDINLKWTKPTTLPNGFEAYEIRTGASWAAGVLLDRTKKTNYLVTDPALASTTFWVGVLDLAGNYDATPPSAAITVAGPGDVTSLTGVVSHKNDVLLNWNKPASLPTGFANYEIRTGASWAAGTLLETTKKSQFLLTDPAPGATTYWVGVQDLLGNYDATPPSVSVTVTASGDVTSLTAALSKKGDVNLKWVKPGTFPTGFDSYEIRVGASWAAGVLVDRTKKTNYLITDPPIAGSVTYWVGVLDLGGNYDATPPSVAITVGGPGDPTSLTVAVTHKQDAKLDWTKPASLPTGLAHYEIRSGASFAAGTFVDVTKKTEYLITDPPTGTTTYWVAAQDLNGNYDATPPSVVLTMSAPGDVSGLTATVTSKLDLLLSWTKPSSLPTGFEAYEIRVGASWAAGTLVDRTKRTNYLITDPPAGTVTYWVGVLDLAGHYDATQPSVTGSITTGFSTGSGSGTLVFVSPVINPLGWIDVLNAGANPFTLASSIQSDTKYTGTVTINFDWYSVGVLALFLDSGTAGLAGENGYFFQLDSLAGQHKAQIGVINNGSFTDIGVYNGAVNAGAMVAAWHHVSVTWFLGGAFQISIDGAVFATAQDTTYTLNGPVCYAYYNAATRLRNPVLTTDQVNPTLANPSSFTATQTKKGDVNLKWAFTSPRPKGFSHFEIRTGASFAAGAFLDTTKKLNYLVVDPAAGATTYWVAAVNTADQYDATPPSAAITVAATGSVTSLTSSVTHKNDVRLSWSKPASFPNGFAHYEIRTGASWAGGTFLDTTRNQVYLVTDPAPGAVTYWVGVLDLNGAFDTTQPSTTAATTISGDVTSLTATVSKKADVNLKWVKPSTFPNGFEAYEIRSGASWAAGTFVDRTKKTNYLITDPSAGSTTYWVGVLDMAGNYDTTPPSVSATVGAPGDVTGLTSSVTHKNDVLLKWVKPASLPTGFANYEIRVGASWAAGTLVDTTKRTSYTVTDPAPGSATYWVGVLDLLGNFDATQPSVVVASTVSGDVTSLTAAVSKKGDINLKWVKPSTFPNGFEAYEIRTGASWAAGVFLDRTKKTNYLVTDPALASTTFWVGVLDMAGNYDATPPSVAITVAGPGDVTSLTGVVTHKNDVFLNWVKPASLPTGFSNFEIRTGASWAAGVFLESTKKSDYLITDPATGAVTYWVGVQDLLGNYDATPVSVTVTVNVSGDVTSLTGTVSKKGDVNLKWVKPSTFPAGFEAYEIRSGVSWAAGTLVDRTKKTNYLITDPTLASTTYWIGVLDLAGNYDATPPSVSVTVAGPGDVTSLTGVVTHKNDVLLKWTKPASLPTGFAHYELRTGASWAAGVFLDTVKANQYTRTDPPTGSVTYWVGVLDLLGNFSATPISVAVNVQAGSDVGSLTSVLTAKADIKLAWNAPSTFPVGFEGYEIRTGASWAAGTFVDRTKKSEYLITDPPVAASVTYWVGVLDLAGNYDATPQSTSIAVAGPGNVTSFTVSVTKKADFLATWAPAASLPTGLAHYEIRFGGASFAAASFLGQTKGTRFLITDVPAGTTTFWVAAKDLNGNYATGVSASGALAAPLDPTSLTATITKKKDVQLTWSFTELAHFKVYEIRKAATNVGFASATLYHRTKQKQFLDTDPGVGTIWYWVAAVDDSENFDATPPGISGSVAAGFTASTVNTAMTTVTGPLNLIGGAANRVSSHAYEVGDVYFAGAANMYAQCVIRGTSGTSAPTFHSPGVTYLDGGVCTFESLGSTVTGYGTFLVVASATVNVIDPSDMVEVVLRMNYAISNLATGDQLQVQLKVDGSSNEIPLTTTDVSSGSSGQGTSAVFQKTLTGLSAGSHTFQFLAALTNASGGGTLGMAIDSALAWAKDYNT